MAGLTHRENTPSQADESPGHTNQLARALWLVIAAMVILVIGTGIPRSFANALAISPETAQELTGLGLPASLPAFVLVGIDVLTFASFAAIALLIFWRRSDESIARFSAMMLLLTGMIYVSPTYDSPLPVWLVGPLIALGEAHQMLFVYRFPDGRYVPRWARWLVIPLAIRRPAMWILVYLPGYRSQTITAETYAHIEQNTLDIGGIVLVLVVGLIAQIYRYHKLSGQIERQQAKWMLYGMFTAVIVVATYVFVFNTLQLTSPESIFARIGSLMIRQLALIAIPVSVALSILRYRLWDIDVVIRRTLIYSVITALLAAIYFSTVALLQAIFVRLTGQTSSLAVVGSTLAIAALFTPLRRRVQHVVDQRFYRRKYDAERTLQNFSAAMRDEVDLDSVTGALLNVVEETLQPEHLSIWLAVPAREE